MKEQFLISQKKILILILIMLCLTNPSLKDINDEYPSLRIGYKVVNLFVLSVYTDNGKKYFVNNHSIYADPDQNRSTYYVGICGNLFKIYSTSKS